MKLKDFLDTPEKWCKNYYAIDAKGNSVEIDSPDAVSWCISGILHKCRPVSEDRTFNEETLVIRQTIVDALNRELNLDYGWLPALNDAPGTTFETIRRVLEKLDI